MAGNEKQLEQRGREKVYCSSCGSLVPPGQENCPVCGMRVKSKKVAGKRRIDPPKVDPSDPEKTGKFAKLESIIPAEQDIRDPYRRENPIRLRNIFVASTAAILIVGTFLLLLIHPWDPNAFASKAQAPYDTSNEANPGKRDSLKGQDGSDEGTGDVESGDEATYKKLLAAYEDFRKQADALDANVDDLETYGFNGDSKAVDAGKETASQIAIAISNDISEVSSTDTTSGKYYQQQQDLITMGNYLRNRADIVSEAWQKVARSSSPARDKASILQPVKGEAANYANLFNQAYGAFTINAP